MQYVARAVPNCFSFAQKKNKNSKKFRKGKNPMKRFLALPAVFLIVVFYSTIAFASTPLIMQEGPVIAEHNISMYIIPVPKIDIGAPVITDANFDTITYLTGVTDNGEFTYVTDNGEIPFARTMETEFARILTGKTFAADTNADDYVKNTLVMQPAAQDAFVVKLDKLIFPAEVALWKMPTINADNTMGKLYFFSANLSGTLDIIPASSLTFDALPTVRTVNGVVIDDVFAEDLVETGLANNSFIRTTDHVDGTVDARKTYEDASVTTVTCHIVHNTSVMTLKTEDGNANARKKISAGLTTTLDKTTAATITRGKDIAGLRIRIDIIDENHEGISGLAAVMEQVAANSTGEIAMVASTRDTTDFSSAWVTLILS